MAGGKLSPRQKMINLMYLVFIAMMALNMSKEVLSAFGLMNEKFEKANHTSQSINETSLKELSIRAEENPSRYAEPYQKAQEIEKISNDFYSYVQSLKAPILEAYPVDPETKQLPFEQMDKGDVIDMNWFIGDKYTEKGQEIINRFDKFRKDIKGVIGNDVKYKFFIDDLEERFNTNPVKNAQGREIPYLDYHYKGFPAIATLAKLSAVQNDIRELQHGAYSIFLGNTLKQEASMRNFKAYVITDKSVYFSGESVKGRVVLGRFDNKTVPNKVIVNGQSINLSNANAFKDGQVQISSVAGGVGEHNFTGKFVFVEDGETIEVDIDNSNYIVVPRPNSATIAADKMNVVYLGLDNPISASFAGIPNDKVNVTASNGSLRKVADGKFMLKPSQGTSVTITATGTMPDGKTVADKQVFRIKQIPAPTGVIRGETSAKGPVDNLMISSVGAVMRDFDFDVNLVTTGFTIVFPNNLGSVKVSGTTLNEEAKRKASRLRSGDIVIIKDIQTKIEGVNLMMKRPSEASYQIL